MGLGVKQVPRFRGAALGPALPVVHPCTVTHTLPWILLSKLHVFFVANWFLVGEVHALAPIGQASHYFISVG